MKIQSINFNIFKTTPKLYYNFKNLFLKQNYDTFVFTGKTKFYTEDEIAQQKAKIKKILEDTLQAGNKITNKALSEIIELPTSTTQARIYSDEDLITLWVKARMIENIRFTNEEKEEFEKAILNMLEEANKENRKITISDIAKQTGISTTSVKKIILSNEYYQKLYNCVKQPHNKAHSKDEIASEEKRIEELLLNSIQERKRRTDIEYGKELSLSSATFKKRVNNNPHLRMLYEQIKNPSRRGTLEGGIEGKTETIRKILNIYNSQNKKVKWNELVQKAGVSHSTLERILNNNEDIKFLWNKVKSESHAKYSKRDIEEMDNYIQWYLDDKIKKGKKTTLDEIAEYFGITQALAHKRLRENPSLNYRWNKVKSQNYTSLSKADRIIQTERIIEILKEANKNSKKLTCKEICKKVKMSQAVFYRRLEENPRLKKLWEENKKQK